MSTRPALPTLFLSHGSPMIALEPGAAGHFMQRLGPCLDDTWGRPRAIVVMSPHTATRTPFVLGAMQHDTIHDFGGFPAALYQLQYRPPGAPDLAQDIARTLQSAGLAAQFTPQGGVDHGIWTVLMHLYPQADVPVVPLSLTPQASPSDMMALGRLLRTLPAQGVLVIGSGSLTHNLQRFFGSPSPVDAPEEADCAAFRQWVRTRCEQDDWAALLAYREQAPSARAMHPTDEHWLPFYFAAGAACLDAQTTPSASVRVHASVTHGHLALDAYAFGSGARLLPALG